MLKKKKKKKKNQKRSVVNCFSKKKMESQHFSFSPTVQSFRSVSIFSFCLFLWWDTAANSVFLYSIIFVTPYILHVICQVGKHIFESQGPYINRGKLTVIYICILKYYNDINNYNNITCIHSIIIIICCLFFFNVYSFYFFLTSPKLRCPVSSACFEAPISPTNTW